MDALAPTASIGIVDESSVDRRLDDIHDGMMHHPVAEWRGRDSPGLAFINREEPVVTRPIVTAAQLSLKRQKFRLELKCKMGNSGRSALPETRFSVRPEQIIEAD